jgi:hypothetical protein
LKGDTGATGPAGPTGPQGATGEGGVGSNLLCFATDQTIGTQGKYMGLGQQGGSHDEVGVITPFLAGSNVVAFVVKASQGNNPNSGVATVFHDDPTTDAGQPISVPCYITPESQSESTTVCDLVNPSDFVEPMLEFDSLSVFIQTDGGNFEGATACVLIDPNAGTIIPD